MEKKNMDKAVTFTSITGEQFKIPDNEDYWELCVSTENAIKENKMILLGFANQILNSNDDESINDIKGLVNSFLNNMGLNINYDHIKNNESLLVLSMIMDAVCFIDIFIHHIEMHKLINNMNSIFDTEITDLSKLDEEDLKEIDSMLDGLIHDDRESYESNHSCCCGNHDSTEHVCHCSEDGSCKCHHEEQEHSSSIDEFRKSCVQQLENLDSESDAELRHIKADDILCSLLIELGYSDVVEKFNDLDKWYA